MFDSRVTDAIYATGLSVNILGWSADKADAIAKSLGTELDEFFPLAEVWGRRIGWAGVIIDGVQLAIGIAENGWQWNEDGWNAAQLALGIGGIVLVGTFGPWIAVATGVVSISIAIVKAPTPNPI